MKIAITTSSFAGISNEPLILFDDAGYDYTINPLGRKMTTHELLDLAHDCDGIVAGVETYDHETLSKLTKLKIISRCGVGLDNIDMSAAEKKGIVVLSTPNGPLQAVAELTLGLMLDALRSISVYDRRIREGTFKKHMGNLLQGKTVGIIGFGNIGRKVGEMVARLECRVIYNDLQSVSCAYAEAVSLKTLMNKADIITLHASGKKQILGGEELGWIGPQGIILINTARGELVDEDALLNCLQKKTIAHACLDVFKKEPYAGPLTTIDNVTLTPHIGSYAAEARNQMEVQAVINLIDGIKDLYLYGS